MKPAQKSARGFTLVEIMTVVVIVGLLTGLAVPSLVHLKKKSEENMVFNSLRQLYDAKEYYFTETGAGGSVNLDNLVKAGYASASLKAALSSATGRWSISNSYLKAGQSVTASEKIFNGHSVSFGRKLIYP